MGYNYSIYLMGGMPYVLLAGFGSLVYFSLRRKAALEQPFTNTPLPPGEGVSPCPPPSTDEVS